MPESTDPLTHLRSIKPIDLSNLTPDLSYEPPSSAEDFASAILAGLQSTGVLSSLPLTALNNLQESIASGHRPTPNDIQALLFHSASAIAIFSQLHSLAQTLNINYLHYTQSKKGH